MLFPQALVLPFTWVKCHPPIEQINVFMTADVN